MGRLRKKAAGKARDGLTALRAANPGKEKSPVLFCGPSPRNRGFRFALPVLRNEAYFCVRRSETPLAGARGIFGLKHKPAWALRAAATSPDRSLEFYAAE
jgi:hypothetical protein